MIALVNTPPKVEAEGDLFLVTFTSGDEATTFAFTRGALVMFGHRISAEHARATVRDRDAQPVPFPKRSKGRA